MTEAASYTTLAEFKDWAAPWVSSDDAELARIIERASRDIDSYCGPVAREADGSAFGDPTVNPKALSATQKIALRNATCAQTLYRIQNGEDWALGGGDQYQSVSGPDFNTTGRRALVSPVAKRELLSTGLVVRGARVA